MEIKTVTIAKSVFRKIEDYGHNEIKVIKDNKAINLEHIMPKTLSPEWHVNEDTLVSGAGVPQSIKKFLPVS